MTHHVASVVHGSGSPVLATGQFARRTLLAPRAGRSGLARRTVHAFATVAQGCKLLDKPQLKAGPPLGDLGAQLGDDFPSLGLNTLAFAFPARPLLGQRLPENFAPRLVQNLSERLLGNGEAILVAITFVIARHLSFPSLCLHTNTSVSSIPAAKHFECAVPAQL